VEKRVVSFLLAAGLTVSFSAKVIANPYQDQINKQEQQLNQKQSELNNQKNALQNNKKSFEAAEKEIQQLEVKIETLDCKIEGLMNEIKKASVLISSKEEEIKQAQTELYKAEEDVKVEQELFNKRMRSMYINGNNSYLEVILNSKGLDQLISNVELLRSIAKYDKQILADLNNKKNKIKVKEEALEKEKQVLVALKSDKEDKLSSVKASKAEQIKLIKKANEKKRYYASKIGEYNKKIQETQRVINETLKRIEQIKASIPKRDPSRGMSNVSGEEVVAYASRFLGTPYVWGGNGPKYFDCSGFVRYVYAHFGISLYRVTYDQVKQGKYVPRNQLKPGDLIFFGTKYNVHHVGMYVGNGCFIHAPHTGDVIKITRLTARSDYYCARRFLP